MTQTKTTSTKTTITTATSPQAAAQVLTLTPFKGCLTRAQAKRIFCDSFIREVRVSYQPTTVPVFKISKPEDVAGFVRTTLSDNSREHLMALFLDGAHQVASFSVVSIGTANSALVHPREVFQRAVSVGAVAIVIAHNHPSGGTEPSAEDQRVTTRLKEAGDLLGIRLLDHVIVTDTAHYSFQQEGFL